MLFELSKIKMTNSIHHNSQKRGEFCKKIWTAAKLQKNRRHTHHWEDKFKKAHNQCKTAKCRSQIFDKCIKFSAQFSRFQNVKNCIFPIKMKNIFGAKRRICKDKICLKKKRKQCKIRLKKDGISQEEVKKICRKNYKMQRCMMKKKLRRKNWNWRKIRKTCRKKYMTNY